MTEIPMPMLLAAIILIGYPAIRLGIVLWRRYGRK
jgi:hypothetical protein